MKRAEWLDSKHFSSSSLPSCIPRDLWHTQSPFTSKCLTNCYKIKITTPPDRHSNRGAINVHSLSQCPAGCGFTNQVILTPRRSVTGEKAKELKGSMVDKEGDVLDAVCSLGSFPPRMSQFQIATNTDPIFRRVM